MAQQISFEYNNGRDLTFTFDDLKKSHKKFFVAAFSLSFFSALLPVAPIVYMRTIFGPVLNSDSLSYLFWLTMLLIFVLLINVINDWLRDRIIFSGVVSFTNKLEERVFRTTFETETKNWSKGADILSRLRIFRNFLTGNIASSILDVPFSLILLLAIFFIHPLMGIFSLFGMIMALIIGLIMEKSEQPYSEKAMEENSRSRRALTEYFRNSEVTMTMGNFDRAFNRWKESNKNTRLPSSSIKHTSIRYKHFKSCNDGTGLYDFRRWYFPNSIRIDASINGRKLDTCKIYWCFSNKTYNAGCNGLESNSSI